LLTPGTFGLLVIEKRWPTLKKTEELDVTTKIDDLILWSCNPSSRFRRYISSTRRAQGVFEMLHKTTHF
jgi:hypothetical protein